jgi:hypothetical protein
VSQSVVRNSAQFEPLRTLTPAEIERITAALQKANLTFRLSRLEMWVYRLWVVMLMLSGVLLLIVVLCTAAAYRWESLILIAGPAFVLLLLVTAVTLLLLVCNIPVSVRVLRDSHRLRRAGLSDTSSLVWRIRGRWTRSSERAMFWAFALLYIGCAGLTGLSAAGSTDGWLFFVMILLSSMAANLLGALVLQRKKEELEIIKSADLVRKSLAHSASAASRDIPVSVLETAARIEGTQIARARAQAVLESHGQRRSYAVAFEPEPSMHVPPCRPISESNWKTCSYNSPRMIAKASRPRRV